MTEKLLTGNVKNQTKQINTFIKIILSLTTDLTLCRPETPKWVMGTLANSEDPDEMPHNATFHQAIHCLLIQIDLQRKKYLIFQEI